MSSRKEELLAKKARLAELKRQRELRQEQFGPGRQSIGGEAPSPGKTAKERRSEIDNLVSSLIDRQREASSPSRGRPSSFNESAGSTTPQNGDQAVRLSMVSTSTQTAALSEVQTTFEEAPKPSQPQPTREYITYSKSVQTDPYVDIATGTGDGDEEEDEGARSKKRSSRRQQELDEEIRASLRKEIEDELRATQHSNSTDATSTTGLERFPLRQLTTHELNAVTSSTDFLSFVERSSKVIERALDEEYDLLADYTRTSTLTEDNDFSAKAAYSLHESLQLYSEKHTRRRMITDLHFSPHFHELLLTSYTKNPSAPNEPSGLVLLWNSHAPSRPEYAFHAATDVLTTAFSPFHPNLVIGGCYSGQVCIWDTRISGRTGVPVQKTPQSGSHLGHTHPVYSISIVGTPNAHNILTADTDGVVCSWSVDMLSQAQEHMVLHTPPPARTDDLAPTSMTFPTSDPTFFLVGTEEGNIYPCHRYDRAGAKAGVDSRLAYKGHTAPVMSTQFHPARGPVDVGDLLLSSSSDWSIKLWRVKPAAASNSSASTQSSVISSNILGANATSSSSDRTPLPIPPLLDIPREDLVYSAQWSPHKPSVFACVTGAGDLEVFDLLYDLEVPVARASPSRGKYGTIPFKGLNKLAWDERNGRTIATGGLDGIVTLFEVGRGLSAGPGEADVEEWMGLKKLVNRLEGAGGGSGVSGRG